jgi:hypothetical protein
MKKTYLAAIAVLLSSFISKAQNTFPTPSGNVGIGTTSPQRSLDMSNAGQITFGDDVVTNSANGLYWHSGTGYGIYRTMGTWTGNSYQQLKIQFDTGIQLGAGPSTTNSGYDKSYVEIISGKGLMVSAGSVGIGTTTPLAKLQVGTSTSNTGSSISMIGGAASGGAVNALSLVNSATAATGNEVNMTFHTAGNYSPTAKISAIAESVQPVTDLAFSTYNGTTGITEQMRILGNGYVGIGTSTPHEALSVNGTIRSKEVKVETANWPDYVFKPNYILPSLSFVKSYIDQNQHLPDMPSEQEITRDGLNLGEMNKILVKKVEELTLYLIQQKEETEHKSKAQQLQIDELKRQIETLIKRKL